MPRRGLTKCPRHPSGRATLGEGHPGGRAHFSLMTTRTKASNVATIWILFPGGFTFHSDDIVQFSDDGQNKI